MIVLKNWKTYFGPNPYSRDPVIEVFIEVDDNIPDNIEEYCHLMDCAFSTWWKGIKKDKSQNSALFAALYITEWAYAALNEVRGFINARGVMYKNNNIVIWLGHHNPHLSYASLKLAVDLLKSFENKTIQQKHADDILTRFWDKCKSFHPDYQAKILMEAARARNIPYIMLTKKSRIWQFGYGKNSLKFFESSSDEDSYIGHALSHNKVSSKKFLDIFGVPIAKHILIREEKQLYNALNAIGFPCVIKPIDRGSAKGVSVNIQNTSEAEKAYKLARSYSKSPIMIESFAEGDVYRLLVIRGKLTAATRRIPAHITGDGVHTILQLSLEFNKSRVANSSPGDYLGPVPIDDEFDRVISEQGYEKHSILENGHTIRLRNIPLQGTGATNIDVTHLVHADIKSIAEAIAESISVKMLGIDYITTDIRKSCLDTGVFLELNLTPSIRGHLENGKDIKKIGEKILGKKPGRIPSILVIAADFDCNAIKNIADSNPKFAWRYANSAGFGKTKLSTKNKYPYENVKMLLLNTCISELLIVCTREEISEHGLPIDHADYCLIESEYINQEAIDMIKKYSLNTRIFTKNDNIVNLIQETLNIKTSSNDRL